MSSPYRIEGYAIVSSNGMIADADGDMPPSLHHEADQEFFYAGLDAAAVVVHGRHSKERDAKAKGRKRVMVTRAVPTAAPDPANPLAWFWNPDGAELSEALHGLNIYGGVVAIIGGTQVFGLFLERGYDAFHLTTAAKSLLPGGRPVFPGIPPQTPSRLLSAKGLAPGRTEHLDGSAHLTLVTWTPATT